MLTRERWNVRWEVFGHLILCSGEEGLGDGAGAAPIKR
jgi:hypothetical protein